MLSIGELNLIHPGDGRVGWGAMRELNVSGAGSEGLSGRRQWQLAGPSGALEVMTEPHRRLAGAPNTSDEEMDT